MLAPALDFTHDPAARAWLESANDPAGDFPIRNLPFGVFRLRGESAQSARVGVALGDRVLDVAVAWRSAERIPAARWAGGSKPADAGERPEDALMARAAAAACGAPALNPLLALGHEHWRALRRWLFRVLRAEAPSEMRAALAPHLHPLAAVEMLLPAAVGDYTDFYASLAHAETVGRIFRPDQPLLPNYKWMPIGYHGRASSLVPSGAEIRRPSGQSRPDANAPPVFAPSRKLDFEMELAFLVGPGNRRGEPIPIAHVAEHIFGVCLLNDWSARDIQAWEYQPLGPFLGKSFATTLSPWVVTLDALAPYRVPAAPRPAGDPPLLPYLRDAEDQRSGALDIAVEAWLETDAMRATGRLPLRLACAYARDLYWTPAQMVAHHASNGCDLRPGDLFATGTISGAAPGARGSLLEITANGARPLSAGGTESRTYLENGDEVTLRAFCGAPRGASLGFGECRGRVSAAASRD